MNPIALGLLIAGAVYLGAKVKASQASGSSSVETPITNSKLNPQPKYETVMIPRLTPTGISAGSGTSFSGGPASGYSGTTGGSGSGRIGGGFGGALK